MNLDFLKCIRLAELAGVLAEIKKLKPTGCRVLEIGAGSGWQAKELALHGCIVEAIDVDESSYKADREWNVKTYDGQNIPYGDESFDIVFSSNVLEHIPNIREFQSELLRVLKPEGMTIHLLPSGSWRFWTNITHYPQIFKLSVQVFFARIARLGSASKADNNPAKKLYKKSSIKNLILKAAFPERHGEKGNSISEIYYFSNHWWLTLFRDSGWHIVKNSSNKLFYTGYMIFGPVLTIERRRTLSSILGGSCNVFVLSKTTPELESSTDTH